MQKADFPGKDRINETTFSGKNKDYYGLSHAKDAPNGLRDIWQYDPVLDTWQKFADHPSKITVQVTVMEIKLTSV